MMIALSGQFAPALAERLAPLRRLVAFEDLAPRELAQVDVLVTRGKLRVDANLLDHMPALNLLIKAGSGLDNIDVGACGRAGVRVVRTGGSERSVAELALALLFACARRVPYFDDSMRRADWSAKARFVGDTLEGRTIGLLGFGAIGQETARLAAALGLDVIVHDRSARHPAKAAALAAARARVAADVADLAAGADILSLHLPLLDETRGVLGAAELEALGPEGILINTARAALVDRDSLYEALRTGRLGAAGLDVHYREGDGPADPIVALPNVVSSPHVGAQTRSAHDVLARRVCEAVEAYASHPSC